jgi:AcrR family transcriptional regulator
MTKREISPDVLAEALVLREVGYTSLAISQRLGMSVRTLQRHFASTRTKKGIIKDEVFQQAKADLLARVTSEASIREEAAQLIADDLAHSRHLREILLAASGKMIANSLPEAVLVMRAAAAYSTAIKNTSDIIRHSLRIERFAESISAELPELVVHELTAEEVAELRASAVGFDDAVLASDALADDDAVIDETT